MVDGAAAQRSRALERLAGRDHDVLVVGGGITGAGIALDAAARGLRVALVERDDLGSGTSSRSSSLVHGGLRYLQTGMVGLTRESAVERDRLRRLAPHLVHPQPFVFPVPDRRTAWLMGTGLWAYDAISSFRTVARHRRVGSPELRSLLPGLPLPDGLWGYEFHDCRTDDARLVLQVARTAMRLGAEVVTRAEAVEFRRVGSRVVGAVISDRLAGTELVVNARMTIAATGVWADGSRALAGDTEAMLRPSKGVHLVFRAEDLELRAATLLRSKAGDGRTLFAIPIDGRVVVGTTDDPYDGPLETPTVTTDDADYVCAAVNAAFGTDLAPTDAVGAWAGLRPLLADEAETGASDGMDMGSDRLSRRHALIPGPDGLMTITGGKLTTYRHMAEEVVDEVARDLGAARNKSTTRTLPLGLRGPVDATIAQVESVCAAYRLDPGPVAHLVSRHGDDAAQLVTMAAENDEWEPLVAGMPYLAVEARWAVEQELAISVADVLGRRTRLATRDPAAGGEAAEQVAAHLGRAWDWSGEQARASIDEYLTTVAAERGPVPLTASRAIT